MPPITARERVRRADPRCQLTIDISWLCQSDFHVPTMRGHLFASFNARAANVFRGLQGEDQRRTSGGATPAKAVRATKWIEVFFDSSITGPIVRAASRSR
jgi:hypothetical protein